jgi:hypothetical protein
VRAGRYTVTCAVGAVAAAWTWLPLASARKTKRPSAAGRQRATNVPPAPVVARASSTQPRAGSWRWTCTVVPGARSGKTPRRRVTSPRSAPGAVVSVATPVGTAGATGLATGNCAAAAVVAHADAPHRAATSITAYARGVRIGPRSTAYGVS